VLGILLGTPDGMEDGVVLGFDDGILDGK